MVGSTAAAGGTNRPLFVLFGSSIVQLSYRNGGWGAILSDLYARKADIVLRGYNGWNSRQAVQILDQVFPKNAATQPSLVIVYFGGNDSIHPHLSLKSAHVPLAEYINNMRILATHLKSLSEETRIIFLTCPPVIEERAVCTLNGLVRTNETGRRYSEACKELCREMEIKVVDLWSSIQKRDDWMDTCFVADGIHLSPLGNKIVFEEILKVIKEAEWEPSLCMKALPTQFKDVSPYHIVAPANTNDTMYEPL